MWCLKVMAFEKDLMGVMVFEKGGSDGDESGDDGVWCWYQAISDNCHSTHWLAGWLLLVCLYIVIVYSPCKYVFFMS